MVLPSSEIQQDLAPVSGPVLRSAANIRDWIVSELARSMQVAPSTIDPSAPLNSLGFDSLAAIGMAGGLTNYLNADLPATLLWDYPTIDAVAAALSQLGAPATTKPLPRGLVPIQPHGSRIPLFVFPGIGGHPVTFSPMATELGSDQPCFGLTVPGLNEKEIPLTTVEDIAVAMVRTMRAVQPNGPYQLAGYSFGGFLAFEAAQQLLAANEQVSLLAIYDTFAPGGRVDRPGWQKAMIHAYVIATRPNHARHIRQKLGRLWPARRTLIADPVDFRKNELPKMDFGKLNWDIAARYQPRRYQGSIVWFRATKLDAHQFYRLDPSGGWKALAAGGVHVVSLEGDHLDILSDARARHAANLLRPFLCDPDPSTTAAPPRFDHLAANRG